MRARYYSAYVAHCVRFYTSHPRVTHFRDRENELDWKSARDVIRSLSDRERRMITSFYRDDHVIRNETVRDYAYNHNLNETTVWDFIVRFEKMVAEKRGLSHG